MPAWIHNRAEHLLAKNPSMNKSTAFAIATQQSHKMGKTPKGYGTSEGKREAKEKYDKPKKEYVKGANPGGLETPKLSDKPKTRWTGSRLVKKEASIGKEAISHAKVRQAAYKALGSARDITEVPHGHRLNKSLKRAYEGIDRTTKAGKRDRAERYSALADALQFGKESSVSFSRIQSASFIDEVCKTAAEEAAYDLMKKQGMGFNQGSWFRQAGFTPKGMTTPAQRLKKSMNVGTFNPDKGLKPLNIKVGSANFLSFIDELYKLAFGPQEARQLLRAAKRRTVRAGGRVGLGYGAIPNQAFNAKQTGEAVEQLARRGLDPAAASSGIARVKRIQSEALGMNPEEWARKGKSYMVTPEKGDATRWFRKGPMSEALGDAAASVKTPEQRMMLDSLLKGHELSELAAVKNPRMAFRGVGHLSPEVILREHNQLVTMPSKTREALSPVVTGMRQLQGEAEALRKATGGKFDFGKNPRLSRHARKRVTELMEREVQPQLEAGYGQLASAIQSGAI